MSGPFLRSPAGVVAAVRAHRAWVIDAVVASALALTGVPPYLDQPPVALAQLVMSAAVAVRRRLPLTAAAVVGACFVLEGLLTGPGQAPEDQVSLIAVPLLAYTVAAYRRGPVSLAGLAVLVTATMIETWDNGGGGDYLFNVGFVLVGWLPGVLMYGRRIEVRRLADATVRLARERDEQAHRVAVEERARLARELHDIVAHSVGVMTVQAAAADQVLDLAPDSAHRALGEVQRVGHQTVLELHRLLGLLRSDGSPGVAPRPGLAQLPDLVTARPGIDVSTVGEARPLPSALDLSAYRIVQEAVTNAAKHAPGAPVRITVTYARDVLVLEVVDTGGPADVTGTAARQGGAGTGPGGHGLIGMRERVALFGGTLETGRRPGGGFAVRACLPLSAGRALDTRSPEPAA